MPVKDCDDNPAAYCYYMHHELYHTELNIADKEHFANRDEFPEHSRKSW